jgi:hypothetical protein
MYNSDKEGTLDFPAITVRTFKFLEYDRTGLFGGMRVIVDELDKMAYFTANDDEPELDGRIMAQRLDLDELYEFRQTGALRLMSGKSDSWDEGAMWDKGEKSATMAISDKAYMIGVYLRKECDFPSIRGDWDKLLDLYNSGKAVLSDITQQLIVLSYIPDTADNQPKADTSGKSDI